jgi:hypothetical protein
LRIIKNCIHINMHIEYSVFINNFMCKHLENIPKKENMYHLVRIFYNKEELNIIIIKISKK